MVVTNQPRPDLVGGPREGRTRKRWRLPAFMVVCWLVLGGLLGPLAGKMGEVADSGSAAYLPSSAEATEAIKLNSRFEQDALPAVVVYERKTGLTEADLTALRGQVDDIQRQLGPKLAGPSIGPIPSDDGRAAQVVVLFAGSDMQEIAPEVDRLRELVDRGGIEVHVTGPAGVQADIDGALGGIDLMLVLVTAAVILLILVAVYRSPILPLLVLAVAGTALGVAQGVVYLLAKQGVLSMGAEVQGILNVLVLGAATDYALLLVARFREELRRHENSYDAMRVAWRASLGPIVASAGTVALGLLCLLVSELGLNRDLGPVGALGIACALVAMLTFMPAVLMLLGRNAFWPLRPAFGSAPVERGGRWARVGQWVHRRPRAVWVGTTLGLVVLSLGVVRLDANGVPESELIIADDVDSKVGQQVLSQHFPAGAGNPAIVFTRADRAAQVVDAARGVTGVGSAVSYSGPQTPGEPGAASPAPLVVDGVARVDVTLSSAPDSDEALATVERLRDAVHAVPGADAKVGGYTAVEIDFNRAAERDRIVMPLLLIVVLAVLALLLRALVAPLLLMATVLLSFFTAIGVSGVVFRDVLGFPGADVTYPLHAFVFLVALGVDYNIFLMTRVREEAARVGTRHATVAALAVTGGVITSAGLVLAATFSALALIPLVLLVELAFTVAFGVLLDTFVVRSLLVPALTIDCGRWVWWPSGLARRRDPNPREGG